jgi:sugar lactone lactonase YvrE
VTPVEILVGERAYLEGPRWRDGALYVSDVRADEVLRVTPTGDVAVVASRTGLCPSGLGWTREGDLLVVAVQQRALLRLADGTLQPFADLSAIATSFTNDMVVDARGRAFIGQAGSNLSAGEPVRPAPLIRVDPDGSVHAVAGDLLCANGMVVADEGRTLLVAETFGDRITAYSIRDDGVLTDERVWSELPKGYAPDGICLDVEGAVWVGCPFVERFVRVVKGGTITDEIAVTGRRAIACTLGGGRGTTLFLLTWQPTAPTPADSTERTSCIEVVEVAVPSAGQP